MRVSINWAVILRISAVLGILASAITIALFVLGVLRIPWGNDEPKPLAHPVQSSFPTATPFPEFEDLEDFLRYAKSIPDTLERDLGLRTLAEIAVRETNYDIAIRAGEATYDTEIEARTLSFVALCAAGEGLWERANQAASKIYLPYAESKAKRGILNLRSRRTSVLNPSIDDRDVSHCFMMLLE